MTDPRLTPATERIALDSLRGRLDRPAYTAGRPARLAVPLADLLREPGGKRDRQVNFGADVTVIDNRDGFSFVQAALDGYCGWLRDDTLAEDAAQITHRVTAPATHVYPGPDLKLPETAGLSLGARVSVIGTQGRFARLGSGGWVPMMHLGAEPATDPAAVALSLLGTPYLWGGNSRRGIDCSGLAQGALAACAIACPGDSDMQEKAFPAVTEIRRGDLLFWPGHVAMALDDRQMVHATANVMAVTVEPIRDAITRIEAQGEGPFLGARRPGPAGRTAFP